MKAKRTIFRSLGSIFGLEPGLVWAALLSAQATVQAQAPVSKVMLAFDTGFDMKTLTVNDAVAAQAPEAALRIRFGTQAVYPGITLVTPGWDLSGYNSLAMDVRNVGTALIAVVAEIGGNRWSDGIAYLEPGQTRSLPILLKRGRPASPDFRGMDGLPGGHVWNFSITNLARVDKVRIYVEKPSRGGTVEVGAIRAEGKYGYPDPVGFFPFVDAFGQYMHGDWPGKIHDQAGLAAARAAEEQDLAGNPGPADRDQYGGWKSGPLLAVTGHFRTEKYQGKWWLVDPEGRLFWSSGITAVNLNQETPIAGREKYFAAPPPASGSSYDFLVSNLGKKYGGDAIRLSEDMAHRRFRSWGINTIGNWSDRNISSLRRTPYVATLSTLGVPKVALPEFRQALRARMAAEKNLSAEDPWCIGYFVDNEIHDWPSSNLQATAEDYYRIVQEEIRAGAPHKLYLGSRIDYHFYPEVGNETIVQAAAKYCDVVSFNRYRFSAGELALPAGVDKPVLIGEFHMGALDRGMPHTGLRSVADQGQRAAGYAYYIRSALANPAVVGAHWFSYADQPFTGRDDGENFQIGWIDVADSPYPEMVKAAREVNYGMYDYRASGTTSTLRAKADPHSAAPRPRWPGGRALFDFLGRAFRPLK